MLKKICLAESIYLIIKGFVNQPELKMRQHSENFNHQVEYEGKMKSDFFFVWLGSCGCLPVKSTYSDGEE